MRRRDYVKLAGGAAVGTVGATGTAAAYDEVIDVVDDLGVDNDGNVPIDDVVEPHLDDGVLLEFPEGQYRIDQLLLYGLSNFGMRATGTASLIPGDVPDGEIWIGGADVRNLRFEGFLLDTTGSVGPTVGFSTLGGLLVRDIEKVGAHASTRPAFSISVTESDGYALIENVSMTDGDVYSDSVGATGIYTKSAGTITFQDCEVAGWGDNGLYASDATGTVAVKGGYYADNNISQVRLSSPGSFVRGATIEVTEPRGGVANMRGVRVCEGPGRVTVEDCDISMERGQGSGGVVVAYDGGSVQVVDSRIHVGEDYTTVGSDGSRTSFGVLVDDPTGIDTASEQIIAGTSITGGGTHGSAVLFRRGDTTVADCCIEQTGTGRDGVVFQTAAGDNSISGGAIDVTGEAIVENDASVTVSNVGDQGGCTMPSGSGSVSLPDLPLYRGAGSAERPVFGTDPETPTAILYGEYGDPAMRSFAEGNLGSMIEDYVQTGRLDLQFRTLPTTDAQRYLAQIGLGVWDKEPEHYQAFLETVLNDQDALPLTSSAEASRLLKRAGVRNYGWIPSLADADAYAYLVGENLRGADGLEEWSDFPPLLYLAGDVAAPQYSLDGIEAWLDRRL